MWGKVLEVIGDEENLVYCSLDIPEQEYSFLPGVPGLNFLEPEERESTASAKELMRLMVGTRRQSGLIEDFIHACLRIRTFAAGDHERQGYVFADGQCGHQIEKLKDNTKIMPAQLSSCEL